MSTTEKLKEEANLQFKSGNYKKAIELYTKALENLNEVSEFVNGLNNSKRRVMIRV